MNMETQPIRINAGGDSFIDSQEQVWVSDRYFNGGKIFSTQAEIANTEDDLLYQTERWGRNLNYAIPITDGIYTVNLGFSEIWMNKSEKRVFDLMVENQRLLNDFDIFLEAAGKNIAINKNLEVEVSDGELNIDFLARTNNPKISSIEIVKKAEDVASSGDPDDSIKNRIQGRFSDQGFLAGGYFQGWFSYASNTPDSNPAIVNEGLFEIREFQINVFDSSNHLIDVLDNSNSTAQIFLQDHDSIPGQADTYTISTAPRSLDNDVFEHGNFQLIFDWTSGGDPNIAPHHAPQGFRSAYFSSYAAAGGWEGVINPQQVETASVEAEHSPIELNVNGEFANTGFLPGGYFEGWVAYESDSADQNDAVTNVGSFNIRDFQINIFDADNNKLATLDVTNTLGTISLEDIDPVDSSADTYTLSFTPNTEINGNAFFEFGDFQITFDWVLGDDPNIAPQFAPQTFRSGIFSSYALGGGWDGVITPQQIMSVEMSLPTDNQSIEIPSGGNLGDKIEESVSDTSNIPLESLRFEAENMNLSGYRIEDSNFASNGSVTSLVGQNPDETGLASMTFLGPPGQYTVVIGYVEENDGQASLTVSHNATALDSWQLTHQGNGSSIISENNIVRRVVAPQLNVQTGDEFSLVGNEHLNEHARIDYLEFIPLDLSDISAVPVTGDGLSATYFQGKNLTNPIFSRIDPTINFNWGLGSPGETLATDQYSVRWTGYITPEVTGDHTFKTTSDDGVKLWVNDQLLIDDWEIQAASPNQEIVSLEIGEFYPITMEYFENFGQAVAQLEWSQNGKMFEVVPQSQLFTSLPSLI
jgi:hypothetical protein